VRPLGVLAALLVLALVGGSIGAVILRADSAVALGPGDLSALRFTVVQAALSALLSVALAVPVARALARRRFRGRGLLVTLMGAPFILPVIVAVLGLVMVFGRAGWVSEGLVALGLPRLEIYGLPGILLAHVFFNLPLATRLILQGWLAVPAERFRLAASLGAGPRDIARLIEAPMLRAVLPGAAMVIFLICTTSFAVALALGGGPRSTTVELAIYQAFRFDFDLGRASVLALLQVALSALAALLALWIAVPQSGAGGLDRTVERWDANRPMARALDAGALCLAALFLLLPLAAIALRGLPQLATLDGAVVGAGLRSLWVAALSVAVTLALAVPLAVTVAGLRGRPRLARGLEGAVYLAVATSPLVIGTGLFLLIFPVADPVALALPVTALVNAVASLPFALRALVPAASDCEDRFGRLAASLGMRGRDRLRLVTLPRMRRAIGFSAALAAALSLGDLGVIALFADPADATLPLLLFRLMASYQSEAAAGVALVLLALSLSVFWALDRGGRVDAEA
jgi:thiamine transport system permease protein